MCAIHWQPHPRFVDPALVVPFNGVPSFSSALPSAEREVVGGDKHLIADAVEPPGARTASPFISSASCREWGRAGGRRGGSSYAISSPTASGDLVDGAPRSEGRGRRLKSRRKHAIGEDRSTQKRGFGVGWAGWVHNRIRHFHSRVAANLHASVPSNHSNRKIHSAWISVAEVGAARASSLAMVAGRYADPDLRFGHGGTAPSGEGEARSGIALDHAATLWVAHGRHLPRGKWRGRGLPELCT